MKTLRGAASQAQIARELGMKQPQYARYESGASLPSADVLIKMCEVFLCSADDILGTHRGGSDAVKVSNSPGAAIANGRNARASVGPNCEQCPFKMLAMEFKDRAAKLPRKR